MVDLKPCPFCGDTASPMVGRTEDGTLTYTVICDRCRTGIFRARVSENEWDGYKSAVEAAIAWNSRVDDDVSFNPNIEEWLRL